MGSDSLAAIIEKALAHHQSGRLREAEAIYRQVLKADPTNFDALHLLGVIANQTGDSERAIELIGRAIRKNPEYPNAHNNLGLALQGQNKLDEAAGSYRRALSIKPDFADAHFNLGNVLQAQGKMEEAIASYRRALDIQPDDAEVLNNCGSALRSLGRLDEAVNSYRQAAAVKPNFAEAYNNLGVALLEQGKPDEAISALQRAFALRSNYFEAMDSLGKAFHAQGKLDQAVNCFQKVLVINPEHAEACISLGNLFQEEGRLEQGIASYRKALAIKPDYAEAHYSLGNALHEFGNLNEAVESYRRAIALKPDYAEAHSNLGRVLRNLGRQDEAKQCFRKALEIKPDFSQAYSSLLFLHAYHGTLDPESYLSLARNWEIACVPERDRDSARSRTFQRPPLAGRRLKIAYVSGDFRQHAVSNFIEQLFSRHDRARVELFAYSTCATRDAVTGRLQAIAEHWIPVAGMSDSAFLLHIEADCIDVLIDLSGHTAHNRMTVFARRAAPVQAHYLGFMASTGLTEMDYWIGDEVLTPPEADKHFTEQVWRLPRVWVSYKTMDEAPEPDWQPTGDGSVWVGSFNNLGKLTPETFALWAKVLHALPQGRLLLKSKELADAGNYQRVLDTLGKRGIAAGRIELQATDITPGWKEHMAYYNRLDIALDPVGGIGGGTTTCDALWMGVPVITLAGDRMATRMTASMLGAIGHSDWIACSEADYVGKVVELARDVEQRLALRFRQRKRMSDSPLCNAQDLTVKLEDACFEMYRRKISTNQKRPISTK